MKLKTINQAVRDLRRNPTRTLLTTLGIIIGISTVILVLSAGEGFRSFINQQVEAYGSNTIIVQTYVPPTTRAREAGSNNPLSSVSFSAITTLRTRDVEDIKRLPNIADAYGAAMTQKSFAYRQLNKTAFIMGADAARFRIDKAGLAAGRFFTEQEDLAAAQVVVLGSNLASDLFEEEEAVGKTLRVGTYNFEVIGVYEPRGGFALNGEDDQALVPLRTAQKKLMGIDYLFYVIGQVDDVNQSDATAEDIKAVLRQNHGITDPTKDDFLVQTQEQSLSTFNTVLAGTTFLLIAVAAISLIVGGVGIMNIMYVAVTERISEIGLKKALGATNADILNEFLVEAVIVTLLGGAIGILWGSIMAFGISLIASGIGLTWAFIVPPSAILLGLGVSSVIGLAFGVFPARRASKLDPIEALRSE
ncbi:MAG: Macrolide transport system ATP-binding/permease protein [Parcubacteria group bacterium GW2011_GWA2_51_12]|nr:MAG: Macrolide transport system ATP-binding/permease protein [Parcubacteria group bacterium GW2011_GWA2_51_12]